MIIFDLMIKAVIVDDEPKAIQSLIWELSVFSNEIQIIQTFSDPEPAIKYIDNNTLDCLFLDIQMPTMDGFQFLNQLSNRNFAVVITSAYNEYAISAFKHEALDYLLKPIDSDDLQHTIAKIKKHTTRSLNSEKIEKALHKFNSKIDQKKITINTDGKLLFIEIDQINHVESDGNYSTFHLNKGQKIVVTKNLKEVNTLLPETSFFRVHNSYIINLTKIKEYIKSEGFVIMTSDHKIPVARQRRADFLEKI